MAKFKKRNEDKELGAKKLKKPDDDLILRGPGKNCNFGVWKEKMLTECKRLYGMLGMLIEADDYVEPAEIEVEDYDLENDPHGVHRDELRFAMQARVKKMANLEENQPKMHATMWAAMSRESKEAVLRHEDYNEEENNNDPLQLWLSIKATHRGAGDAVDAVSQRSEARQMYRSCVQGPFESIAEFKRRFSQAKEAYHETGNAELLELDVSNDFFEGLDNNRYAKFKADIKNDRAKGVAGPATLNDMYQRAANYVVAVSNWKSGTPAAFMTTADKLKWRREKPNKGDNKKNGRDKSDDKQEKQDKTKEFKGTCYKCQEKGHMARDCTKGSNNEQEVGVGLASVGHAFASRQVFSKCEVLLDNQASVSALHPGLLRNVRCEDSWVSGLSGAPHRLPYVGDLEGFFECKGSTDLMANVLCMADVEDLFRVTYKQGKSYTVHLESGDLVFKRRNKLYVADMSEWWQDIGVANVTTTADNEQRYRKHEVARAQIARDITVNSGFSSERDTLGLVNDGNISGVPVTSADVRRSYDIYGKSAHSLRGRRTQHRVRRIKMDTNLKGDAGERQTMQGDIMYAGNQNFVACLTKPLDLMTLVHVKSLKTAELGDAVQSQVDTIRSRGFLPQVVYLDPQPGFVPLQGQITGVEVDISGAGDHMDALDMGIRRLKEIMRSVHSALPWRLPPSFVADLAYYAVSRKNLKSTPGSAVSPRVKFTGRKPTFRRELGIGFGDYVEVYDPTATGNIISKDRTSPAIALYPTGNANESWTFYNLATKRRVRRSNWQKMVTSELIIDAINAMADAEIAGGAEEPVFEGEDQVAEVAEQDEVAPQEEEAAEDEEDGESVSESATDSSDDEGNGSDNDGDGGDERNGPVDTPTAETDDENSQEVDQGQEHAQEEPPVRKSARIVAGVRKPQRYFAYHTSVKKGLEEHGEAAYSAIVAELKQLLRDKKAITPVRKGDLSSRQLKKAIRSFMFLKAKFDGIGRFEKVKARLVANGAMQDRKLYPDTHSPTAMLQSLMMVLSIAALEGRKVGAIDIGGAYLNAERDPSGEEVIMELEPTLVKILAKVAPEVEPYVDEASGKMYARLDKAMYGTLDAARIWYDKLTSALRDMGFEHNAVDPCVMNKIIDGKQCTLVVYVDDLLISCVDSGIMDEVVSELKNRFGEVKYCAEKDISYLGMHIVVENGSAAVSMEAFVRGILAEHPVTGVASTPATANLFDNLGRGTLLDAKKQKLFHTITAKLLYLAKRARVDILLAVSVLCTRVTVPTDEDWVKLERVLKYLNGTPDQVLVMKPTSLEVQGHIDAAFGCHGDGKSHTGMVITVGGATVMCCSSKQKIVTKDSTESELCGLSDKVMDVVKCNDFLKSQGYDLGPPVILQDNTSTITLVTKGGGKYRNKYMKVRQGYVKERVDFGDITLQHLPTTMMLADVLTKPLQGELYRKLTCGIVGKQYQHVTGVR